MVHQRLWLSLPPTVLCLADAALTLRGQPLNYWTGGFSEVLELNPLGYVLLAFHPLAFAAGVAIYMAILLAAILQLPARWAVLLAFVLSIGHLIGGAGWLAREGVVGWLFAVCLIVASERLVGLSWRKSGQEFARS